MSTIYCVNGQPKALICKPCVDELYESNARLRAAAEKARACLRADMEHWYPTDDEREALAALEECLGK